MPNPHPSARDEVRVSRSRSLSPSLSLDMMEEEDRRKGEERTGTRNDSAGRETMLGVLGMCYLRDGERVGGMR